MNFKWPWMALFTLLFSTFAQSVDIFQLKGANHSIEYLQIRGFTGGTYNLALHHYKTHNNSKVAVTTHGYGDHCAYMAPVHQQLLSYGYDILCLDLPGHGYSSGNRLDIDNFNSYELVFETLFATIAKEQRPLTFVGFSTGNVGLTQWMLRHHDQNTPFEKIIMISPLVRSFLWDLSAFGQSWFGWIPYLPMRRYLHNIEYQRILNDDPFKQNFVPMNWVKKLFSWNEELKNQTAINKGQLHIVFAGNDTTLDLKFCQNFYGYHFPNAIQYLIQNVDHEMFLEPPQNALKLEIILERLIEF